MPLGGIAMNLKRASCLSLLFALGLFSCSTENASVSSVMGPSTNESTLTSEGSGVKAIVVYFSATSHTEKVAQTIASHTGFPLYELEPVEPYSSSDLNYSNASSRVVTEHNDPNRHTELKSVAFEGFSEAKYVFLGAPVWWQELSWVVDDFVKLNDFSNKTIIPFGTSASSSFSTSKLETLTENATWLSPKRFSSNVNEQTVISWVDGLNLD